jgi:hypothetical protein
MNVVVRRDQITVGADTLRSQFARCVQLSGRVSKNGDGSTQVVNLIFIHIAKQLHVDLPETGEH